MFVSAVQADLRPGTIAVYSDNSAMKLLSADERESVWQDQRLRRLAIPTNPLLPISQRVGVDGKVERQERLEKGRPSRLLKAQPGKKVEFSTTRVNKRGASSTRNYECTYLGESQFTLPRHRGKARRYRCERYTIHKKLWTKKIRETREFSYSPSLGLITHLVITTGKKRTVRHLLGLIRPGEYSYERIRSILSARDNKGVVK